MPFKCPTFVPCFKIILRMHPVKISGKCPKGIPQMRRHVFVEIS